MQPIGSITGQNALRIEYVLMDIDDTITTGGKLPPEAYAALWKLHRAGLKVVPITGRPAGWCDLIAREWPVDGVVGENGALVFWEEAGHVKRLLHEHAVSNNNAVLQRIQERVLVEVPGCRIAGDQFARMFDLAIDFAEEEPHLTLEDARRIKTICDQEGAVSKISSIHVNTWLGVYDKLGMAVRFLTEQFGYDDHTMRERVMFFGDSPNDEPMFAHFPQSVGVSSVIKYRHLINHLPGYITQAAGGEGFAEGVELLLARR